MLDSLSDKVSKENAAVIVVDMQNDFCHPEGIGAKNGGDVSTHVAMAPRLARLLERARAAQVPVIFIQCIHNKWTTSEVRLERRQDRKDWTTCWEGSWGAEWYGVAPEPEEYVVVKHRFSAFIGTDLDLVLRSKGIKTIIMTGVGTNVCVESTTRDGFMLDYYVVFVEDCTATSSGQETQDATLRKMRNYGEVHPAATIEQVWATQAAEADAYAKASAELRALDLREAALAFAFLPGGKQ